jgi:hypothetical protein
VANRRTASSGQHGSGAGREESARGSGSAFVVRL